MVRVRVGVRVRDRARVRVRIACAVEPWRAPVVARCMVWIRDKPSLFLGMEVTPRELDPAVTQFPDPLKVPSRVRRFRVRVGVATFPDP